MTNKQKKTLIITSISLVLLIGIGFLIKHNSNKNALLSANDSARIDSAKDASHLIIGDGEEEESFPPCRTIAQKSIIFSEPDDKSKMIGFRPFGSTVYVKDYSKLSDNSNDLIGVYFQKPTDPNLQPNGYMHVSSLIANYNFDDYNKFFSLPEFAAMPAKFKKMVMDNKTYGNHSYYPTQDVNRSKFCICYGDFNADSEMDMAIVLDDPENQTSKFMILCTNTTNKLPYLAYETGYDEYVKISTIKSGTVVQEKHYNESESESETENAPEPIQEDTPRTLQLDGIYVKNELINQVILYNMESNKFKSLPVSQ